MVFLRSNKKNISIIVAIYLVANFFLLLNYNGIYWDAWCFHNHSFNTFSVIFLQSSNIAGYVMSILHYILLHIGNGIFIYRILTVLMLLLSGLFVYNILKTLSFYTKRDRFIITLFFLLAPLYIARVTIGVLTNTFFYFLFFLSFFLLSKYYNSLNVLKRVTILSLFFLSFLMNSLLVFYFIVLLFLFYQKYSCKLSVLKNFCVFIYRNIDFIFLPIVFYIVKVNYFFPYGLYYNYNKIDFLKSFNFNDYCLVFQNNFIIPIRQTFSLVPPILFIILFFVFLLFLRRNTKSKFESYYIYSFLLGILFFILGAFPYLSVGKIPTLFDWDSRHQILLFLGFSFILYFGIEIVLTLLKISIIRNYLYTLIMVSFVLFHLKIQYHYNIDWFYQESIMENIKENKKIANNSTFIVDVILFDKLVNNRKFRAYELNGMSRKATKLDNKFYAQYEKEIEFYKDCRDYKQYNFSDWNYSLPIHITISDNLNNGLNQSRWRKMLYFFKLKYWGIFERNYFKEQVKNLIFFKVKE